MKLLLLELRVTTGLLLLGRGGVEELLLLEFSVKMELLLTEVNEMV